MPTDQEIRQTKRIVVIGTNGTGKTTLLHKIIQNAQQKTLIITPYDNEWNERDPNGNELYPLTTLSRPEDFNYMAQDVIYSTRNAPSNVSPNSPAA